MKQFREASRYLKQLTTIYQYPLVHLPWWQMPLAGYLISVLLVALVVFGIRVLMIREIHFLWLPFCLVSVLVGSIWGVSPALLATLLGFLAFNFIIIPQSDILTFDVWRDIRIIGPFVLAQFCIALIAAQNAVKHRRALIARQELDTYALELTALNRQLAQTNQELEKATHLQEDFMTRAAHELRTPLTTILGETQLAIRRLQKQKTITPDPQIYQHHFTRIEDRAHVLRALIEDLIVLNNVRSAENPLHNEMCNFSQVCSEVTAEQQTSSRCQIELQLPSEPVILKTDCQRIFQMMNNLISNAIHYLRPDTVLYVCIKTEPDHVLLQVHIHELTLSEEQQAQFFEPFYHAPYVQPQNQGRWGLGLTISKEIVQRLGGQIGIQSPQEQSTIFFVQLPL